MAYGKSIDFLFNQMRNYAGSLAAGSLTFYSAGTTTPKAVYLDRDMLSQAANPYTLTADGTAELYGNGLYRIVVKDSTGVIAYDFDNVELIAFVTSVSPAANSTHTVVNTISESATIELTTDFNQYITRTGDTVYTLTIVAPAGYSFADGLSSVVLTSDNETVQFLLNGIKFYMVV